MKENRGNTWGDGFMRVRTHVATLAMLACLSAAARGQQCDTHEQCVTNGMCMPDGTCQGTPLTGPSCDLLSDALCMVNGHCVNGACLGDPAPEGTSCASGCGTCQPPFPGVPVVQCVANAAQVGQPCATNLGACFTAVCQQFGQPPFAIAACIPQPRQCPDTDNNPCTTDACNPATGMCEHSDAPPCIPQCETCSPGSGCQPANIGAACDSSLTSECPVVSSCQTLAGHGVCLPGTPSSTAPTPTATPTPMASPVPTTPAPTMPPSVCVGDCAGTGTVAVNNIITLVNITLGTADISACPNGVPSNGEVNVAVIIQAVNNALNGCGVG
jgi:hypothetical protein